MSRPHNLALLPLLGVLACHSNPSGPAVAFTGHWGGEYKTDTSASTTGVWTGVATQNGSQVSIIFFSCGAVSLGANDTVSGSLLGSTLTLTGVVVDTVHLTGAVRDSAGYVVASGRFTAVNASPCFGGAGTWSGRNVP